VLIDDGNIALDVISTDGHEVVTRVVQGGRVSDHKGINLPGVAVSAAALDPHSRDLLEFALELGVDWVAMSFVRSAADADDAREVMRAAGRSVPLIAKIEKPEAVESLEAIVDAFDGIMVARGDLGVEIPHEDVPGRQKELVRACRLAAKPVIVATQMLESMISTPTPTRAEASDVATAIYDGADAVMLSAESATGNYPREAVEMMDRIISSTEQHKLYRSIIDASQLGDEQSAPHAVAAATADLAKAIHASAIVGFTSSGTTADENVSRRLCLLWGAHSVLSEDVHTYEEMVERATAIALSEEFVRPADAIIVVAGIPFGQAGTTNNLRVVQAGRT
jgi:pyruvate kinase